MKKRNGILLYSIIITCIVIMASISVLFIIYIGIIKSLIIALCLIALVALIEKL